MTVVHGGDVWQGASPDEYLDFSANLNPEGPPDWVLNALSTGLRRARYYPDLRGRGARAGMAAHLGLPEDSVLVTSGGIEAAALASFVPGRRVIAQPTFQEYGRLCDPHLDIARDELRDYAFERGDILWICNPNNPTGEAMDRESVIGLLERVEAAGGLLVVDEAFIEYCPEHSVADLVASRDLVVLGSLTKVLAIPGIRLGYLAAKPELIAWLSDGLLPWRINCVAEAVAEALPGHGADFERIRALNDHRRAAFAAALAGLGARVCPSKANFLLCDFGRDMRPVIERLRQDKILIRPCGMFPGLTHGHVRLCVRTEAENARLIEALGRLLR
ncbi:MAG: aminotransferase class I/II-fold pyridoxal phosphate-dependent enzyme [Clostridia bacterium]|nr:aminotransferase class I/II-fold pyridoxal phosphate-dependent enzyme [Clostridia bacterium]